jgi:hypothetical protein
MRLVRRRLSWIAGLWLVCQVAALAAAPCARCPMSHEASAADANDGCCPGVAPGQYCPMHHTREGGRKCAMHASCGSDTAALASLADGLGLPALSDAVDVTTSTAASLAAIDSTTIVRVTPPDSPPPRA